MTDVVITAAKRTPVGSFLGAFAATPAHELGRVAIEAALEQAGVAPEDVSRSHPRPGADRRPGPEPGPAGLDGGRRAEGGAGLGRQPGLRLGPARGRARRPGDPDRRRHHRRRRRAGEHEPLRPRPESARRHQDGRPRPGRHDDQGRPDRRLQRLSYGHHRRESGRAISGHPRRAGRLRRRQPEQGRGGPRRRPLPRRDRAGHDQGPQGRHDRRA